MHIEAVPEDLKTSLSKDAKAKVFFESLPASYKRGYCDWVGSVKNKRPPGKQGLKSH